MALPDRYSSFDFEPYKFHEFPKQVEHNGVKHVVLTEDEERELLAIPVVDSRDILIKKAAKLGITISESWKTATIAEIVNTAEAEQANAMKSVSEEKNLLERADKLGLQVDKRWGLAKLKAAVENAEA